MYEKRERKKIKEEKKDIERNSKQRRAERILGPASTRPLAGVLVAQNKALQKESYSCKKWPSSFNEVDILLYNVSSSYLEL